MILRVTTWRETKILSGGGTSVSGAGYDGCAAVSSVAWTGACCHFLLCFHMLLTSSNKLPAELAEHLSLYRKIAIQWTTSKAYIKLGDFDSDECQSHQKWCMYRLML